MPFLPPLASNLSCPYFSLYLLIDCLMYSFLCSPSRDTLAAADQRAEAEGFPKPPLLECAHFLVLGRSDRLSTQPRTEDSREILA